MKITEKQKNHFEQEGFMIVPDFLTQEELEKIQAICNASIQEKEEELRSKGVSKDGINVFDKKYFINHARKNHFELKSLIFSEKCAEVCKATIGENAYLHNEQFVVKMTDKATTFAWHQDSGYSVFNGGAEEHNPYITFWIALDDMSSKNGTISVLPFSREPSSRQLLEHTWDDEVDAMVGYRGDDPGDLVEVSAGSLVAFSSRLLHKSGANTTDKPRRSYFLAFTPDLFHYKDSSKGVYNSGEPLLVNGVLQH